MNFTAEQKQRLLSFPIEKVLYLCGHSTEHTKSRLYHSPFREDRNPSFMVTRYNTWVDYGTGESGGVLDLVCRLQHVSVKDAYDWLARNSGVEYILSEAVSVTGGERDGEPAITIKKEEDIFFTPLLAYVKKRGVELDLVCLYCRQLRFDIRNSGRVRYALGFPNNAGGWVLRTTGKFKGCNKGWITTLNSDGKVDDACSSSVVVVFEGFYNFLSYLQLSGKRTPGCDVCVLNSVGNVHQAFDYLARHATVNCCIDNDNAGTTCLKQIVEACPDSEVIDRRDYYTGYNDINDYLLSLRSMGWTPEE